MALPVKSAGDWSASVPLAMATTGLLEASEDACAPVRPRSGFCYAFPRGRATAPLATVRGLEVELDNRAFFT